MTATIIESDTDIQQIFDLEFAPPCDIDTCDSTATWMAITKCCGNGWLFCEPCITELKDYDAQKAEWGTIWECTNCDQDVLAPIILSYEKL